MPVSKTATTVLLAAFAALSQAGGQTTVWKGTNNTNWNPPPNWSGSVGDATTQILFDGTATNFTLDLNGNRSARGLAFSGASDYTLIGAGSTLSLGAAGISHTGAGNHTLSFSTLAFDNNNGAGDISVDGTGVLTINSNITGGGGVALNKSGAGLLILTGNNSYSGPTTVSAGILRITNGSALGSSVYNNTVQSGATLQLAGTFALNQSNLNLAGTGSGGIGALNSLSGTQTFAGSLSIHSTSGATLSAANGATFTHTGAINGGIVTTSGAGTINLGGSINISGFNANGSGTLNLTGGSSLDITAFNVNGGTVVLNRTANGNLLNTDFVVNGGTLRLAANQQIADSRTLRANSGGTIDLNNFNETVARLRLEGGAVTTGSGMLTLTASDAVTTFASATTATIAGNLRVNSFTTTFDIADGAAATDLAISAVISGGGMANFVKAGDGTLVLSGANTFTTDVNNGVRIQAGVLQVSADNNLGNASNRVLLEGGTLRLAGTFTAAANRVFQTSGPGGTIDVTAGNTVTLNTADRLRGSAPLTKTGAGTLELNQANTNFTGNATLSGGTTRLGDRQALGSNASATHTVGAGATLEAAFADNSNNFEANLILAGGTLLRTSTANQKAGFQINNAGSSLTVTADSVVRDASNDAAGGFLTLDGVVNINAGVRLTADSVTANSEVRFGGSQNILLVAGSTLATTGSGLVSLGSGSARTIIGQGTAASQATLSLGAADHTSNAGSRFQIDGSGIGGLRVQGTQARVDAFVTDARLAATTGSGGTLTIAYTNAGNRTLGVTANLAAASNVMLGLESAGGTFTLDGSLANWGGLVVGPSTTVSFGISNVFGSDDALVMRGGTITLGNTSQDFASFEVVGSSVLDFGAGDGTLTVGSLNIADGATLTVRNWTQSADYFFSLFDPGEANLARVYFEAQDKSGAWNKYGDPFEITPVPEPSAYGALALGGLVGWVALRRRRRA